MPISSIEYSLLSEYVKICLQMFSLMDQWIFYRSWRLDEEISIWIIIIWLSISNTQADHKNTFYYHLEEHVHAISTCFATRCYRSKTRWLSWVYYLIYPTTNKSVTRQQFAWEKKFEWVCGVWFGSNSCRYKTNQTQSKQEINISGMFFIFRQQ